jgi:hypothetical protein
VGDLKLVMCLCKIFVEGNCHPRPRPGVAILTCRSHEFSANIPIFYIPITQAIKAPSVADFDFLLPDYSTASSSLLHYGFQAVAS